MKLSPVLVKILTLSAGLLGLLLHLVLLDSGADEKGLLISGFWAGRFLLVLSIALAVGLIPLCRTIRGNARIRMARPGVLGAVGAFAGSIALGATAIIELDFFRPMPSVLGLVATVTMLAVGVFHLLGKKPYFLLYALMCAYFAFRMVAQYQSWNATPQIMEFVFYLGAYVLLMIHTYQYTALSVGLGNYAVLWWTGLTAVFLCFISVSRSSDTWLMLGSGVWVITNLPRLLPADHGKFAHPQEEV